MSADLAVYLDSSALVKLVIAEPESAALSAWLRPRAARASCSLAVAEVIRAVRPHGDAAVNRARRLLQRLDLIQVDHELLEEAAIFDAGLLRTLDAIHLAAARALGDELDAVVTYDARMAAAAAVLDLPVVAPR